jgi:hypothetical protein
LDEPRGSPSVPLKRIASRIAAALNGNCMAPVVRLRPSHVILLPGVPSATALIFSCLSILGTPQFCLYRFLTTKTNHEQTKNKCLDSSKALSILALVSGTGSDLLACPVSRPYSPIAPPSVRTRADEQRAERCPQYFHALAPRRGLTLPRHRDHRQAYGRASPCSAGRHQITE